MSLQRGSSYLFLYSTYSFNRASTPYLQYFVVNTAIDFFNIDPPPSIGIPLCDINCENQLVCTFCKVYLIVYRCSPQSKFDVCERSTHIPVQAILEAQGPSLPLWANTLVLIAFLVVFRSLGYVVLRYFRRPKWIWLLFVEMRQGQNYAHLRKNVVLSKTYITTVKTFLFNGLQ